jgi:hypothetical protein
MRELRSCDGCGGTSFVHAGSFAGERATDAVEIVLWRCDGCGDESEVVEPFAPGVLAGDHGDRAAA